jgi:hypothetical protein
MMMIDWYNCHHGGVSMDFSLIWKHTHHDTLYFCLKPEHSYKSKGNRFFSLCLLSLFKTLALILTTTNIPATLLPGFCTTDIINP